MLTQLLIIQIIFFIGLVFMLRYIFSRNLSVALKRLNTLHEENLVKETQLTEELKRAKEEREAEVVKGKQEAKEIIEESKKEAAKLRQKLEDDARGQSSKILAQAASEADELKAKLTHDMQLQSLELAVKMIEETFTEKNKEYVQHQFISEIIDEVAKLPKERFTVSTDKVRVVSSHPLEREQREQLKKVLEEKLDVKLTVEEVVDKSLISGLTVEIGGLVIDGTLKNRLQRVIPGLTVVE